MRLFRLSIYLYCRKAYERRESFKTLQASGYTLITEIWLSERTGRDADSIAGAAKIRGARKGATAESKYLTQASSEL